MNEKMLFKDNIYGNGNPTYYLDRECTKTYTGHVEIYHNGMLSEELEVVSGLQNGIAKEYDEGYLCDVSEKKNNYGSGFEIEYYSNGKIQSISISYRDCLLVSYRYSENGELIKKIDILECDKKYLDLNPDNIWGLVSVSDLERMNEEILKYGFPLNLPKGFEFISNME